MYVLGAAPALVSLFVRRRVKDPDIWVAADDKRRDVRARVQRGELVGAGDRQLTKSTLAQLFQSPELRRRLILLFLAPLSTTMGWWAVSSWIPLFTAQQLAGKVPHLPTAITTVVIAYNVVGLAGYFLMGVLADWLGRKPAMMIYFAGSLVVVPLLFLTPASPPLFIALAGHQRLLYDGPMDVGRALSGRALPDAGSRHRDHTRLQYDALRRRLRNTAQCCRDPLFSAASPSRRRCWARATCLVCLLRLGSDPRPKAGRCRARR